MNRHSSRKSNTRRTGSVRRSQPRSFLIRDRKHNGRKLHVELQKQTENRPQDGLAQLASEYGIQTSYIDMTGKRRRAKPQTLQALLELLGEPAHSPAAIAAALRHQEERNWSQALPPSLVVWNGQSSPVLVRMPCSADTRLGYARVRLEDGSCKVLDWPTARAPVLGRAEIMGTSYAAYEVRLPRLPYGYHQLEVNLRGRIHQALVICAPVASYSPPDSEFAWGVFAPLYAAHSANSWGAGNLTSLSRLAEWSASLGAGIIATLPLLATFLDAPCCEPSPYSAASRLFWNEFYLDIQAVPEWSHCAAARKLARSASFLKTLEKLREDPLVDYPLQSKTCRRALELMAEFLWSTDSPRKAQWQAFINQHPRVSDYAKFRAACDRAGTSWHTWEERMRQGKIEEGDYSIDALRYHLYVQWLANNQISLLSSRCRELGLRLYMDLPVGVSLDSYDTWRERDSFILNASAGAPPDPVFAVGQDWGFAPLHPQRIRQRGFHYLREALALQMRHAGMLRVDHIMGLHRLFWIPRGMSPSDGAYVTYPAEELQAMLCLESRRHRTVIIGENLGTVPPDVNASMKRHGFRETYVVQYEQRSDAKAPLRPPPPKSVASLNTHDMPTFAAHCRGLDIDDRAEPGVIPSCNVGTEKSQRLALCRTLAQVLLGQADSYSDRDLMRAATLWLAASHAETLLINIEDLWGEIEPQNVPGTRTERPNWRRKFRLKLEEIQSSEAVNALLTQVNHTRQKMRHKASSPLRKSQQRTEFAHAGGASSP